MDTPRIFEFGPGRKYRVRSDKGHWNGVLLEMRLPHGWELITAPDIYDAVMKALARTALGDPVEGFRWTLDDRYVDDHVSNPFRS